jgi:hypothetical protein
MMAASEGAHTVNVNTAHVNTARVNTGKVNTGKVNTAKLCLWAVGPLILMLAVRGPVSVEAYPAGPPPATTGGFGEATCVKCHDSNELNAGKTLGLGDLTLSGFPTSYRPGQSYPVTIELTQAQASGVWGFQLSTRTASAGNQAGELKPMSAHTRVAAEKGVQYVQHTADGTFFGTFEFTWVAPAAPVGDVTVSVAGNAANGDASPKGDYIYATSITMSPAAN